MTINSDISGTTHCFCIGSKKLLFTLPFINETSTVDDTKKNMMIIYAGLKNTLYFEKFHLSVLQKY